MQTFMPNSSFGVVGKVLDNTRLNKQILEARQILAILIGKSPNSSWSNHPAVRMWVGYPRGLFNYMDFLHTEFMARKAARGETPLRPHQAFRTALDWYLERDSVLRASSSATPYWRYNEDVLSSHRGRLLHKGNIDITRKRIRLHIGRGRSIDDWVHAFGLPRHLRDCTVRDIRCLNNFLDGKGVSNEFENWYDQFGWSESPSDDYVWPVRLVTN